MTEESGTGTNNNIRRREFGNANPTGAGVDGSTVNMDMDKQQSTFSQSQNGKQTESSTSEAKEQCSSMTEYYERLRRWVFMYKSHAYMQQHMMFMMPYVAMTSYMQQLQYQQQQSSAAGTGLAATQTSGGGGGVNAAMQRPQQMRPAQNQQIQNVVRLGHGIQPQPNGALNENNIPQIPVLEFSTPSVYRRVVAELIDFFLLFSAKLGLMLVIIDYLGISSDTTGFMMRFLVEEIEDDTSLEELQQMLLFAFIYRIIVCVYETFFLCSHVNRNLGGATPGKFLMRLRVISLEGVQSAGPRRVLVTLPDSVSFTQALLRSVVKNFSMAFFFPACVTVFFNPHFRAAYEVLTRTMVVGTENWPIANPARQRRGQNAQAVR